MFRDMEEIRRRRRRRKIERKEEIKLRTEI
jgi:hypothetical protein